VPGPTDCTLAPGSSQERSTLDGLLRRLGPAIEPADLASIAHYRLRRLLGQGGMGAVFLADDTQLQRSVAVKVILPEMAAEPTARDRFLREARAAAAVKSDHITTIYQVGQHNDVPFLVMEYLQGESLDDRLGRVKALPLGDVVRIGREVAEGLAAAHEAGLVHRDIKPANVWLEAPNSRAKLLDFGLARPARETTHLTETGLIIGTPDFMSPEQARGESVDARSDLFSLGVMLYGICTGRLPFQGTTIMAVLTALATHTPRPLREEIPDLPAELSNLVSCLLEKEPDRRPASARVVAEELRRIEAGGTFEAQRDTRVKGPTLVAGRSPTAVAPPRRWSRRAVLGAGVGLALFGGGALAMRRWFFPGTTGPQGPPVRVGILHSQTGTMAISEKPVIDAVRLAIEEVNRDGGVLGRPVEPVVANGESDDTVFARQAERLILQEQVCTIFGCWTSASRKAVRPVVEKHDSLLYYPVQYEGLEQSPNIVYGGPVPNQQIEPALKWLAGFERRRKWFLVGSDYVFPQTANAIIRDLAPEVDATIVGERYLLLGSGEVGAVVKEIVAAGPDLIVNTINGDTNLAFFRSLRHARVMPAQTPTVSFSISEQEILGLKASQVAGDYAGWSYFESVASPQNQGFLQRFRERFGTDRVVSDPMQAAYAGVFLWAQAVRAAGSTEASAIRAAIKGQRYDAPQGLVEVDAATLHTSQTSRVGRINGEGRFEEVFVSPKPIRAVPFPATRSRADWKEFQDGMYRKWGNRWANPGE